MHEPAALVDYFDAALPLMRQTWLSKIEDGREARRAGRPRQYHGRHRGLFFRGWDEEHKKLISIEMQG